MTGGAIVLVFFGAVWMGAGCGPTIPPGPTLAERAAAAPELARVSVHGAAETAAAIWLRAGSAFDPTGREGTAWLAAHGRTSASAVAIDVDADWVRYEVVCPVAQALDCVTTLVDAVFAPAEAAALSAAREAALAWIAAPDAEALGPAALDLRLFRGHPYGHAARGRASVLPLLELAEIERFRQAHELRSTARAGIAGEWSPEAEAALAAGLARLPARAERAWPLQRPEPPGASAPLVVAAASGVGGAFGGRTLLLPPEDPAWPALLVALAATPGQVPEAPGWFGAAPREHGHVAVWSAAPLVWPPATPTEPALRAARASLVERARPSQPAAALRQALAGGPDASSRLASVGAAEVEAAVSAHLLADSARWIVVNAPGSSDSVAAIEDRAGPVVEVGIAPAAPPGQPGQELFR